MQFWDSEMKKKIGYIIIRRDKVLLASDMLILIHRQPKRVNRKTIKISK